MLNLYTDNIFIPIENSTVLAYSLSKQGPQMQKKSHGRKNKFIQSCYYKFRAHRSLSTMNSNPLLVPNSGHDGSLCPSSTKKTNMIYHHKTETDWNMRRLSQSTQLRKSVSKGKKDRNMEDAIVVCKVQSFQHEKTNSNPPEFKRQRSKQAKPIDTFQSTGSRKDYFPGTNIKMKNLLKSYDNSLSQFPKQNAIKLNNHSKKVAQRSQFWKSFPNRHRPAQQSIKNESILSFRGWDFDSRQNQQQTNLASSKHPFRL